MRSNRILVLAVVELVLAIVFVTVTALVVVYQHDQIWMQLVLALGGIAGLLNGAYLLKLRRQARTSRRPPVRRKR